MINCKLGKKKTKKIISEARKWEKVDEGGTKLGSMTEEVIWNCRWHVQQHRGRTYNKRKNDILLTLCHPPLGR